MSGLGEDVHAAILAGDTKAVLGLLAKRSEKERTALAGALFKTFELAHGSIFSRDPSKPMAKLGIAKASNTHCYAVWEASKVALLRALREVEAIRKYGWRGIPKDDDVVVEALRDRPRDFVLAWVTQLCDHTPGRWDVARRLVKEGLCDRPTSDGYVLGMVHVAALRASPRGKGAASLFAEDPALFENDIWRIFEVEGNRDVSLTSKERFWQELLVGAQSKGALDRARMLDATLGALARDFPQHKAGFYSRLHDALAPTAEERAARAGTYVELLGSRIAPTVSLATRAVEALPEDVALDLSSFARAATSAARSARGQSTALVLLRLLARHHEEPEALEAVAAFLEHGAVEVVDAALEVLEKSTAPADLVARVAALVPAIAASRRARVTAWVARTSPHASGGSATLAARGSASTQATGASASARAAAERESGTGTGTGSFGRRDALRAGIAALEGALAEGPWPRVMLDDRLAPRLDPARRIAAIEDVHELLACAARVLEEPNDRVTFERVIDGISRLGAPLSALPAEATKPLAKRAAKLAERSPHAAPKLIGWWLSGEADDPKPPANDARAVSRWKQRDHVNTSQFGMRRVRNIAGRLAQGVVRPLLSMPATEGFFVDPRALAERVRKLGKDDDLDVEDAVVALLRLAPDGRKDALKLLRKTPGVLAAAVRHALGSDDETIDGPASIWFAAARARGGDDAAVMKAFPKGGPDAGEAARIALFWKEHRTKTMSGSWGYIDIGFEPDPGPLAELPPSALSVLLATNADAGHGAHFGEEPAMRELASYVPVDRRSFLAHGVKRISGNVDWSTSAWENHVFIETLLDPDVPLDDIGLALLAIALNTKEARENALATDALIGAIQDGRVVGPELGKAMAFYWDPIHDRVRWSRRPTASRWAKTLGTVAQTSALHAEVVRRIVESFFGASPAAPPADAHALLQLWLDLAVEAAVGVPSAARDVLARYTGKAKKVAGQLLALDANKTRSAHAEEAHALGLEGRRARAARWTRYMPS